MRNPGNEGCVHAVDPPSNARSATRLILIRALVQERNGPKWGRTSTCADRVRAAVQVAAAEALTRQGKVAIALPVLERWLANDDGPWFGLQAANVLDRLGESARPTLGAMREKLQRVAGADGPSDPLQYQRRILEHAIGVLEGKAEALVYPINATATLFRLSSEPRPVQSRCKAGARPVDYRGCTGVGPALKGLCHDISGYSVSVAVVLIGAVVAREIGFGDLGHHTRVQREAEVN